MERKLFLSSSGPSGGRATRHLAAVAVVVVLVVLVVVVVNVRRGPQLSLDLVREI